MRSGSEQGCLMQEGRQPRLEPNRRKPQPSAISAGQASACAYAALGGASKWWVSTAAKQRAVVICVLGIDCPRTGIGQSGLESAPYQGFVQASAVQGFRPALFLPAALRPQLIPTQAS